MRNTVALGLASIMAFSSPVLARETIDLDDGAGGGPAGGYLQCVPYARQLTGIGIYGDAHTWWSQAAGRYARGTKPRVGAVMAVQPRANSRLGHVAAVTRLIDERTVLISHANWSERGKIENDVRAVDVSPANDWSEVRIWYGPSQALGTSHWPLYGFIYGDKPGRGESGKAKKKPTPEYRRDPIGAIIARAAL